MKNFDLHSMKYIGILLGIILIFVLVVGNAYNYLPSDDITNPKTNGIEKSVISEDSKVEENEESQVEEKQGDDGIQSEKPSSDAEFVSQKLLPLEAIEENSEPQKTATMEQADKYMQSKDYTNALLTYKSLFENSDDKVIKAECCEKMATIYAISKKYGTALAFAQKAFNLAPNSNRELLMARLYYKTGEIDKATERVNYILKRDFTQE